MASSEVDQKFLGRFAKALRAENPLLSSILYKILGLSLSLAEQLVATRWQLEADSSASPRRLKRVLHIIWLSREGLVMLQQYVMPMISKHVELKVLAYKLRASFHHVFVLLHNQPAVSRSIIWPPKPIADSTYSAAKNGDKEPDRTVDDGSTSHSLPKQPTQMGNEPPLAPPPGFAPQASSLDPSVLLPAQDFLPAADLHFKEAMRLADQLLWGSHTLRLSIRAEYAAFLHDCAHDANASRTLARDTIAEIYDAPEGIDDDMFRDACKLLEVLERMSHRGAEPESQSGLGSRSQNFPLLRVVNPPPGMENPI